MLERAAEGARPIDLGVDIGLNTWQSRGGKAVRA